MVRWIFAIDRRSMSCVVNVRLYLLLKDFWANLYLYCVNYFRGRSKELSNFIIPISRVKIKRKKWTIDNFFSTLGQTSSLYYSFLLLRYDHTNSLYSIQNLFQIVIFITFTSGTKLLVLACWQFFCKRDAHVCTA